MTDILLINPPNIAVQNNPMPFGLAYIASYLEKNNFSVRILDLSVTRLSNSQVIGYIKKMKPKTVGISCMSVHVDFVKAMTKKIKEFSDIRIFVGGIHPTALTEKSMKEMQDVDVFVIGEGEITALQLMKGEKIGSIKGISYVKNGKLKINPPRELMPDLDKLPHPARHLLPGIANYTLGFDWEGRTPAATIFSSRGCPFGCIYCASKVMWKGFVRFRSVKNVLNEIDCLVKEYNVREILFYDDHFTLNKKRLHGICNGLLKRNYDLTWCCLSRADSIDIKTARLMKKSGCHMISFGVESGSQKVLDGMEKRVKVKDIINAFSVCRKAGINTKASFIFGGPRETHETIQETRRLLKTILPDYAWFFIMTPMPGTKLYKLHEESGISTEEWSMYDQTTYNKFYGTSLTYDELRKTVSDTYKWYYLSPEYAFKQIKGLNTRKMKVLLKLLRYTPTIFKYVRKGRKK